MVKSEDESTIHAPQLDLSIVGTADNERQGGMKGGPVDAAIVTLEHVLDDAVGLAEEVGRAGRALQLGLEALRSGRDVLLAQARYVPDAHRLVERGRDDVVLARMELGAHDIVVVAGEDAHAVARLPIPDADGLIVRGRDDPRILVMEECGADVVQVAEEGEQALALLVVPHLDLVVVAARHEQRLLHVEGNAAHRAVVLVELVDECAHAVVPELDDAAVERGEHPWSLRMEREALDAWRFGL